MNFLHHEITHSMRPMNKELEWLSNDDDFFDQYIEYNPFEISEIKPYPSSPGDFDPFFEGLGSSRESPKAESLPASGFSEDHFFERLKGEDQDEEGKRWVERDPALSRLLSDRIDDPSRGKAAASKSELLSLDELYHFHFQPSRANSLTPVSPSPSGIIRGRKVGTNSPRISNGRNPTSIYKSPRKPISRMMSPQKVRSNYQEVWMRRSEAADDKSSLQLQHQNKPLSPPLSGHSFQDEFPIQYGFQPFHDSSGGAQLRSFENNVPPPMARKSGPQHYTNMSPLQSPQPSDMAVLDSQYSADQAYLPSTMAVSVDAIHSPPQSAPLLPVSWPQQSNIDTSNILGCYQSPNKAESWWNASKIHNTEPSQMHNSPYQLPHRPVPLGLHSSHERNPNTNFGLGISTCNPETIQSLTELELDGQQHIVYPGQDFPVLPRLTRRSSPSPPPASQSHIRPSPQRSRSSHHRRAKSASSTHSRATSVGFVNFTPGDSKKILNGVAPSGSSKTKARREREAAEKRRKLSEAAVRAVLEAGGDVESVRRLEGDWDEVNR